MLTHIVNCIIAAVANTDGTSDTQGTIFFVIFPPHEVVFLLIISRLGSNVATRWPFWLQSKLQEPQGAQRLLSSQCRSCGAGSSYIWLLGLCWQPCQDAWLWMNEWLNYHILQLVKLYFEFLSNKINVLFSTGVFCVVHTLSLWSFLPGRLLNFKEMSRMPTHCEEKSLQHS